MRWLKEKDPLAPKGAPPFHGGTLLLLVLAAGILSLFSFWTFDARDGTGDVGRAVSYFEDFFSENDAIAVFLGWEGK